MFERVDTSCWQCVNGCGSPPSSWRPLPLSSLPCAFVSTRCANNSRVCALQACDDELVSSHFRFSSLLLGLTLLFLCDVIHISFAWVFADASASASARPHPNLLSLSALLFRLSLLPLGLALVFLHTIHVQVVSLASHVRRDCTVIDQPLQSLPFFSLQQPSSSQLSAYFSARNSRSLYRYDIIGVSARCKSPTCAASAFSFSILTRFFSASAFFLSALRLFFCARLALT